jgi:hypothetical protein
MEHNWEHQNPEKHTCIVETNLKLQRMNDVQNENFNVKNEI